MMRDFMGTSIRRTGSIVGLWFALMWFPARSATAGTPLAVSGSLEITDANPLEVPPVGAWRFRVLSPAVLEVQAITTVQPGRRPATWDFVDDRRDPSRLPAPAEFRVEANGRAIRVRAVGFRRRVLYAPYGRRDLRLDNRLFLSLDDRIPDGALVTLRNPARTVWTGLDALKARADVNRASPAIHVNQVGYVPAFPKHAFVGYYLGTLGELPCPSDRFEVVEEATGRTVLERALARRRERGFEDMVPPYREVFLADFSEVRTPGVYRVRVPGLGVSAPVRIHDGAAAAVARAYALGFYHQRCGAANELPFTRFTHEACHLAPAQVPTPSMAGVRRHLAEFQQGVDPASQAAPILDRIEKALFPYSRTGPVDVHGGHHDAGDYSKYTPNSAAMIHALVLAADVFPGVNELDNLGLPESGNQVCDLLDIARWEADFLARMQDEDGGFYSLVYPRDRAYEDNVLPDHGDPQVVFPKNTTATAAATAALAQAGSSPAMRRAFPKDAAAWLAAAERGWKFLEAAWARYGRRGAYQRVMHYGEVFEDRDEMVWAAMEMLLATGRSEFGTFLRDAFDPGSREIRYYGWIRMFEGYGNAIRSCALASQSGRPGAARLDPSLQARCRAELLGHASDLIRFSEDHAYGVSLHPEYKRHRTAGWHFTHAYLFDLAAAGVVQDSPDLLRTLVSNLDYPLGANPVNVSYVTGLGLRRLRDLVSAFALNDHRLLPPSGLPVGDLIPGLGYLPGYDQERRDLSFPPDDDPRDPYPFYDRFADSWNTQAEVTVPALARCLAGTAALMARTPLARQPWRAVAASLDWHPPRAETGKPWTVRLEAPGLDLSEALVVWDVPDHGVFVGPSLTLVPGRAGPLQVEAEAQWPDGRRVFATAVVEVRDVPRNP